MPVIGRLRITTLAEDTAGEPGLMAEHGLCLLIEADGHQILFDAGQGKVLLANARRLGADLRQVEAVVLSHGHYDHTGGLAQVLPRASRPVVHLHPAALEKKYARADQPPHRSIGIPDLAAREIHAQARGVVRTRKPTEVLPGIYVTGEIPRHTDFESASGPFFLDEQCRRPDPVIDDQALYVDSIEGLVVVLGCAHAGVVNTLEYISHLTGRGQIRAVLGGMHLLRAPADWVDQTLRALERLDVQTVAPCHCTGLAAVARFQSALGSRVVDCRTGSRLQFGG
jgi:7,8-dihydropterin-6-yl-methyl-4-(beta-D-ribofuranosyl)aminobenzene 5'-phosphate synthase